MIRTMLTDDSQTVCAIMQEIFSQDSRFTIVGTARNGLEAVEMNRQLKPDLIIMDLNMPVMDGITATRTIMAESSPAVIAFSTEDAARVGFDCIEAGALEMVPKPDFAQLSDTFATDFCNRMAVIAEMHMKVFSNTHTLKKKEDDDIYDIMLIGASTGGPSAIQTLLSGISPDFPLPILVTQHIDKLFDIQFVKWLDSTTGHRVHLAQNGIIPEPGQVYIAPAEKHLTLVQAGKRQCQLCLSDEPPLHFLKPAVDIMFKSAASVFENRCLAVLLTGMGKDGAEGCLEIVKKGGYTITEAESSCVVYGMPKAAVEMGGAKSILPLQDIAGFVQGKVEKRLR